MRKTCLNSVYSLAKRDDRVIFIGSDLGAGLLDDMKEEMPDRFIMEGVAEQNIVGMAAGMAMEGYIPFFNTIATFITRRAFEQVAIDLCLHDLPVRLIANGGGAVYAPLGPTHLAVEDIATLRSLPNMTIVAPCDADEMLRLMDRLIDYPHPVYVRVAKGGDKVVSKADEGFQIGKAIMLKKPGQAMFVTTGVMAQIAVEATELLSQIGIDCGVMHMHTVKPLDIDALQSWMPRVEAAVTVEEHVLAGGLGSAVLEACSDFAPSQLPKIARVGIPDEFATQYGSQNSLLAHWGITAESLAAKMKAKLEA